MPKIKIEVNASGIIELYPATYRAVRELQELYAKGNFTIFHILDYLDKRSVFDTLTFDIVSVTKG